MKRDSRKIVRQSRASDRALLFVFLVCLCPGLLFAQSSTGNTKTPTFLILCKQQKAVRTLRVSKNSELYDTVYTKNGKDQVIGQTRMFSSGKNIAITVKDTLIQSGWSCREVSDSQLTTSETKSSQ